MTFPERLKAYPNPMREGFSFIAEDLPPTPYDGIQTLDGAPVFTAIPTGSWHLKHDMPTAKAEEFVRRFNAGAEHIAHPLVAVMPEPIGVVADRVVERAAAGPAGVAAIITWRLTGLSEQLQRKGYGNAFVAADYATIGAVWRLHVTADVVPSLFRRYVTHDLDKAIAGAEEWIAQLPEGR